MKLPRLALACSLIGLLLTVVGVSPVNGALLNSLTNGDFDNLDSVNPTIDGWGEHEIYNGPGPNGAGNWGGFGAAVPGAVGNVLGMIRGDNNPHTATVMQSIGTVDASDVGKILKFSVGAVAWDWFLDFDVPVTYSAKITASFREGATPDNGDFANFNYGTLLGTEDSIITGVTQGNGIQDGIGDEGGLHILTATYIPSAADIGKDVSVVIDLGPPITNNFGGENRYQLDNATLTVIPEPATWMLLGLGMLLGAGVLRRSTQPSCS